MAKLSENIGSAARDYAMLERNLLSHIRLACVLLLLSSSLLLKARIPAPENDTPAHPPNARISLASLQFVGSLVAIGAGAWEYRRGYKDMQDMKGFLMATKYVLLFLISTSTQLFHYRPHFYIMSVVSIVVFASTIVIIVDKHL